jgi:large subunit ribosomal protein L10
MPAEEKIKKVADLKAEFEAAPSVAVTDYSGLTVDKINELRRQLRERNIRYLVAKNTLLRIAAREAGMEGLNSHFVGPTAVAFGADDPGVLAKTLYDFGKANEKPQVRALLIEGRLFEGEEAERIAKLPPREQLLAEVVGMITAPLQNLVGTLDG